MQGQMPQRKCLVSALALSLAFLPVIPAASGPSRSGELSQRALFARCYIQLTGTPVPRDHDLLRRVVSGNLSAPAACSALLDRGRLSRTTGRPICLTVGPGCSEHAVSDGLKVLRKFQKIHRSWFPVNAIEQAQGYSDENARGTENIVDTTEPALMITRAALSDSSSYSSILTARQGVRAIREESPHLKSQLGWTVTYPRRHLYGINQHIDLNEMLFHEPNGDLDHRADLMKGAAIRFPRIQVGELTGIVWEDQSLAIPNYILRPLASLGRADQVIGVVRSFDFFLTQGGGILGLNSFLMTNFGHEMGVISNGTTKVPRRWSQVVMQSLLCRTLPALRVDDIQEFKAHASSTPFRTGNSCLQCHATLDPMAYTARNLFLAGSAFAPFSEGAQPRLSASLTMVMGRFERSVASVPGWHSEPVQDFARQEPKGRILYRQYDGELFDRPVTGIQQLGEVLAESEDLYVCAAKRYFEHFTGIRVSLHDLRDPALTAKNKLLTDEDLRDRKFVERIGTHFARHRSVPTLVNQIIQSNYFSQKDFSGGRDH